MAAAQRRRQTGRRSARGIRIGVLMKNVLLLSAVCCLLSLSACRTVGVSRTSSGFAEVSPTVAAEMILDSNQVVVLDVRTPDQYRGPEGHIGGALSAPLDTIERPLPGLLPYQNQNMLVYCETPNDGAPPAQLPPPPPLPHPVPITRGLP